jgi:tetratricopeptide (TPR) repeat protein
MEMGHFLSRALLFFLPLIYLSCGIGEPYLSVIQGNADYNRGDFQKANIEYIQAMEGSRFLPWINYNLGNVYYSLGELEAALAEWKRAEKEHNTELQFRLLFNMGVYYYENNEALKAYEMFKSALKLYPESADAKINLELSFYKSESDSKKQASGNAASASSAKSRQENVERVLEYVKKRETSVWTANDSIIRNEDSEWDW